MRLRFWGTRGNIATPGMRTVELGGHTTCIEVSRPAHDPLIIDSGTGITDYARQVMAAGEVRASSEPGSTERNAGSASQGGRGRQRTFHIIISHFHWDHIIGFPFFFPIHDAAANIHLYSAFPAAMLEARIRSLFDGTYSPLEDLDNLPATITFQQLPADGGRIDGARVVPFELDHSEPSFGFRIEASERSIGIAIDHEARDNAANERVVANVRGVDLLVHDAQLTEAQYATQVGQGHSCIEAAIRNAHAAQVRALLLTHHDPAHSDDFLRVYLQRRLRLNPPPVPLSVRLAAQGEWYPV